MKSLRIGFIFARNLSSTLRFGLDFMDLHTMSWYGLWMNNCLWWSLLILILVCSFSWYICYAILSWCVFRDILAYRQLLAHLSIKIGLYQQGYISVTYKLRICYPLCVSAYIPIKSLSLVGGRYCWY